MLDLILIAFMLVMFGCGFWCGKTYGTYGVMFDNIKQAIVRMLGK